MLNDESIMAQADLHVHTMASDGTETPSRVVEMAFDAGLAAVGICDHDTIGGLNEALAAGERMGITVVSGIEINTDSERHEIHILGYFIDPESPILSERLDHLRSERMNRGVKIVNQLNQIGIGISMDRVREIADGATIGRPHIARAMIEAGYVASVNSAFGKYLVRGAPGFVERYKLSPMEAIQIIRQSGGVAVMAHPASSHRDEIIPELVDAGLQGLEAYHTDHTSHQRKRYIKLAKKYDLVVTGGSDYHGPNMTKDIPVGNATCDASVVHRLHELAEQRRSHSQT